jgi:hypothetical protein
MNQDFSRRLVVLNLQRDRSAPVLCPFCRETIPRPEELEGLWFEFDGGVCPRCGASFAVDPTARNGGAVLTQAVVQACGGDWDKALSLAPGVDFDEGFVVNYDSRSHRINPQGFGTVYFVRLRPEHGDAPGA